MGRHILVPIDGSEASFDALAFALAQESADRLTVLTVVDPAEGVYGHGEAGYYSQESFDHAMNRAEERCEQAKSIISETDGSDHIEVITEIEIGRPARTITEFAEENEVDHIVMGSQGRSGVSRLLLGSVAESVVRRSPVPVTVYR